jgi:hypothetical protein
MEYTAIQQCKNCGQEFNGKYCTHCGEKVYGPHDKTVTYIFEEAFHFITHFEGNFFTSIRAIFKKPGTLSFDYCNGIRKRYYKPVSMFFFVIVVYLLFPGIFPQGLNMEMKYHANQNAYHAYATRMIEAKMQQRHMSYAQVNMRYHEISHNVSKFMLFILLPFSTLLLLMLFPKRGVFYDHFMIGTEINVFFLLYGFMLMPLVVGIAMSLIAQLAHVFFEAYTFDLISSAASLAGIFIFCFVAFKKFYGASKLEAGIKAAIFTPLHYLLVFLVYKFLLFAAVISMV